MTDITAALELARKTIERLAVTHREINECGRMEAIRTLEACARYAADDAASLARALLALAAERDAMAVRLTNVNASLVHSLAEHNRRDEEADSAGAEDRRTGILVGRVAGRAEAEESIAAFVDEFMNNEPPTDWRLLPGRIRAGAWRDAFGVCRHCAASVPPDCNCCARCADERGP